MCHVLRAAPVNCSVSEHTRTPAVEDTKPPQARRVLRLTDADPALAGTVGDSTVIGAEVIHTVREEAALKLADVVFRRTELGTGANPGEAALETCADDMAGSKETALSSMTT